MFHFELSADSTIVHVSGNVDLCKSTEFPRLLAQAASGKEAHVIVAFDACRSIDASALAAIAACRKRLGDDLHVVVPPLSRLRETFKLQQRDEYERLDRDVQAARVWVDR